MSSFAADIGGGQDDVRREFLLQAQVPLLHVWPNHFIRNGIKGQREDRYGAGTSANAGVSASGAGRAGAYTTRDIGLRSAHHQRRGAFQRFTVGLVTISVLVKNSIAAADGHLAVAFRIPGKANTRSGIKQVALEATSVGVGPDGNSWERRTRDER